MNPKIRWLTLALLLPVLAAIAYASTDYWPARIFVFLLLALFLAGYVTLQIRTVVALRGKARQELGERFDEAAFDKMIGDYSPSRGSRDYQVDVWIKAQMGSKG